MENILKNITLECAKNRFYNNFMPALDCETLEEKVNECCWGDFPYDVIIEKNDKFSIFSLGTRLPMLPIDYEGEEISKYLFRFGNIVRIYAFLKRVARETTFYKLSVRQDKLKWVEITYDFYSGDTLDLLPFLPSPDDYYLSGETCDIVAMHSEAELFNSYFRIDGENTRYEINFKNFVEYIFSGGTEYKFNKPYIDLPIAITESIKSVGDLLSDEELWKPNKKYYIGDIVRYDGEYYILERGVSADTFEVTGELYKIVDDDFNNGKTVYNFITQIPSNLDHLPKNKLSVLYDNNTVRNYKIVSVYYKGHYDEENKITNFDGVNPSHWEKIKPEKSQNAKEDDILIVSRLDNFTSVRKTYDNENNELPFNIISKKINNETVYQVALPYTFGYTNYAVKNNGICVDYFNQVEFLKDLTDEEPETITYNGSEINIIIDGLLDGNFTYIRFTYYIGCEVVYDQTVDTETGIKYIETRPITLSTTTIKYGTTKNENQEIVDEVREFNYFEISDISEESKYCNPSKACAKVIYNRNVIDTLPLHVFSNDKLFGTTMIDYKQDEVNITRGSYGAFERHNILGEINSMEDLQNYRNNYFKL